VGGLGVQSALPVRGFAPRFHASFRGFPFLRRSPRCRGGSCSQSALQEIFAAVKFKTAQDLDELPDARRTQPFHGRKFLSLRP
jgi:hypothetical protein